MDAYTSFAQVYDLFMDNVPYEQWSAFLCRILKKYGIEDGPILDLGCGTGKLTRLMAKAGYDMTGGDASDRIVTGRRRRNPVFAAGDAGNGSGWMCPGGIQCL